MGEAAGCSNRAASTHPLTTRPRAPTGHASCRIALRRLGTPDDVAYAITFGLGTGRLHHRHGDERERRVVHVGTVRYPPGTAGVPPARESSTMPIINAVETPALPGVVSQRCPW